MNEPTTSEVNWEQLRPMLDEAVGHLKDEDRHALLLRFFQGMNHQQIGAVLGLSEDTARKRVERALEKLRAVLARQGITTSSAFLVLALGANTVQAAPPNFATQVAYAPLADAGSAIVANTFWKTLFMTTKTKSILAASVVLAALIVRLLILSKNSSETSPVKSLAVSAQTQPPALAASPKPTPNPVSAPISPPAVVASSPPIPGATSASPAAKAKAAQVIAVRNNLFRINNAAQMYLLDHDVGEVRYADLVTDKTLGADLRSIVPVSGENYDSLVVHETDTSLSLAVPGLGVITLDQENIPNADPNTNPAPAPLVDEGTIAFTEGVPVAMTSPAGQPYTLTAKQLPDGRIQITYNSSSETTTADGQHIVKSSSKSTTIVDPDGIVSWPKPSLGIKFKPVMN